jgi:succinyl-diaminopimelate desuccinylase
MVDLLALTEELCAIPSVSGDEHALADVVESRLRDVASSLQVERVGNSVIARSDRGLERRIVLGGPTCSTVSARRT